MIIAIDGPAASGKGTLGKRLAHHYGYRHLDTGVIYRAVAKALLDAGAELTDEARAVATSFDGGSRSAASAGGVQDKASNLLQGVPRPGLPTAPA